MNLRNSQTVVHLQSHLSRSQWMKLMISILLLLSSALVLALRMQQGVLVLGLWILLGVIAIRTESRVAIGGVTVFSLLLYIGPQMGWLYGRDTHSVAVVANHIVSDGWPIPDSVLLTWSAPYTPGIHFQIAVTSLVTDLPIMPSVQPAILAPALVPLVYTITILLFSYLFARRLIPMFEPRYFLAIIFWTSVFYRKTVPRRHALGFVFFIVVVYLGYQFATTEMYQRGRFVCLFAVCAAVLTITHHLLSIVSIVILAGISVVNSRSLMWRLIPLQVITVSLWFVFSGLVPLEVLIGLFGVKTPETIEYANRIFPTTLSSIRFGTWFIYAALLALPVIWAVSKRLFINSRLPNQRLLTVLVIGAIVAPLSIASWQLGLVAPDRLLTVYIAICGPFAIWSAREIHPQAGRAILVVLLVAGIVLVPFHVISSEPPLHQHLEDSQRHSKTGYAAAEWLSHGDGIVIADSNMYELITPIAQREVYSWPGTINTGRVPPDQTVVLQQSNAERYFGTTPLGTISINPPNLWKQYNSNSNRVYNNGDVRVYR